MVKKYIISILVMTFLISGTISCQPNVEKKAPKTSGLPIKMAKYYWPGEYWVEIADKKGWFKEAGLNVELVDTNPDYFKSLDDMVAGKMDTNNFSFFDLLSYNLKGADLVAVINCDNSSGSEAIVAREGIGTIRDLRGKKVGVTQGTYLDYILELVISRNGMDIHDILVTAVITEKTVADFIDGKLDAIITWEPLVTEAIQKGKGKKLFDTSEMPGILPNIFAFHRSFIEQRAGDVQAIVNVWHRTTTFIKENPKEAFGIIAEIYQKTPGEAQELAQVDKINDLQDNLDAFSYSSGLESLHGTFRYLNNYMIKHGNTDELLDSSDCLDARFVRTLVHE